MKYYSSREFFEEGKREGREMGRAEGRMEGREAGRAEGRESIIRKMLSMGQSVEFISQCTEQPVDYIRQIATKEPMLVREENVYKIKKN